MPGSSTAPAEVSPAQRLPKRSGHEVRADLKADPELRRLPVAVLSLAERDVIGGYDQGANRYLTEPVDVGQLLLIVQSIESLWLGVVRLPPR